MWFHGAENSKKLQLFLRTNQLNGYYIAFKLQSAKKDEVVYYKTFSIFLKLYSDDQEDLIYIPLIDLVVPELLHNIVEIHLKSHFLSNEPI